MYSRESPHPSQQYSATEARAASGEIMSLLTILAIARKRRSWS